MIPLHLYPTTQRDYKACRWCYCPKQRDRHNHRQILRSRVIPPYGRQLTKQYLRSVHAPIVIYPGDRGFIPQREHVTEIWIHNGAPPAEVIVMELHLLILFVVFTLSNGGLRKMSLLGIQAVIVIVVTIDCDLSFWLNNLQLMENLSICSCPPVNWK